MRGLAALFRPELSWGRLIDHRMLRNEAVAGFIAAVIIIPQAAALATLAGMPAEYGIYTSILPVMVAALFGSSWHSLAGPNTAVSIMVLATVLPFANLGTGFYIALVLTLTLLVGVAQLLMALARLGHAMDLVSHSVIVGVTHAVGVIIVVTAGSGLLGVYANPGDHFLVKVWNVAHDLHRANPYALVVGGVTLAAAVIMRRWRRRYALVVATGVGIAASESINFLVGSATSNLELLGRLPMRLFQPSQPEFRFDDLYLLQQLIVGAVAIAFVGVLQAVVIAKTLAEKSGQHLDINREIVGQGMANVAAAFSSGFAGSASFNRSAAHYSSGARTPLSAMLSGLFLLAIALSAAPVVARISTPVISAVLIMVGWGLLDFAEIKRLSRVRGEAVVFGAVFLTALLLGLTAAVFVGVVASVALYLAHVSRPVVVSIESQGGHSVLQLRGNLFFGSADHVKKALITLRESDQARGALAIDVREAVYLDAAAARVLHREAEHRASSGGRLVLHLAPAQWAEMERCNHCLMHLFVTAEALYAEGEQVVELHPR